jgi:hypothetical protein
VSLCVKSHFFVAGERRPQARFNHVMGTYQHFTDLYPIAASIGP